MRNKEGDMSNKEGELAGRAFRWKASRCPSENTEFVIRRLSGQIVGMWKDPERLDVVGDCLVAALHCPRRTLTLMGAAQNKISLCVWPAALDGGTMVHGQMTVVTTEEPSGPAVLRRMARCQRSRCCCVPRVWVLDDVSGDVMQPFDVTPPFSGALTVATLRGFEGWLVAELKTPGGLVLDPDVSIGHVGTVLYASRVLSPPVLVTLGESREFCEDDLLDVRTPRSPRSSNSGW